MESFNENLCPRCGHHQMKEWDELNAEQKMLVEKLPASAEIALEQRKNHRFCERCWFEDSVGNIYV
jgi:ribosomal protein S27AE